MPLSRVECWPRNPKQHADAILSQSVDRFGFVQPLLIDETTGRLIAGHGRLNGLLKMKQAGMNPPERVVEKDGEWMVPVIRGIGFASEEEAEAYLLADNQTTILGGWNDESLQAMLSLHTEDLSGLGWRPEDIEAFNMPVDSGFDVTRRTDQELRANWIHPDHVEQWLAEHCLGQTLNVCCGQSRVGHVRVDTDPKTARTLAGDLYSLTYKPSSFDTVICDPPFSYYKATKWLIRLSHIAKKRMLISSPAIALTNFLPRFNAELWALADTEKPYFLRLYWIFDRKT